MNSIGAKIGVNVPRQLTIGIPTYNRVAELELLLDSIASQCMPFQDRLNVHISDNASAQDLTTVLSRFEKRIQNLTFIRRNLNAGPDRNIADCFLQGANAGNFVWVIGDDDVLMDGALKEIFRLIDSSASVIYVRSFGFNDKPVKPGLKKSLLQKSKLVSNPFSLVNYVHIYVTYISAWIFDSRSIDLVLIRNNIEKLIGTHLVQLSWVIPSIEEKNQKLVIVPEAFVAAKSNNSGGYGLIQVFCINLDAALRSINTSSYIYAVILNFSIFHFLVAFMWAERNKSSGFLKTNAQTLHQLKAAKIHNWRIKLFLLPILERGKIMARAIELFTRIIKKWRDVAALLNLLMHSRNI